jgi:hypothetical protein
MAASTKVNFSGNNRLKVNVTGLFSVGDETDTIVVDKSSLIGPDQKNEPSSLRVDDITWTINGYNYILLEWEHTTDDRIVLLSGAGYLDYSDSGGNQDPRSEGGTGDIVLTTNGGQAGGSYSIDLNITLKK